MKKRLYILIILLLMTIVGIWVLFYINKHYYIIWNANTIEVKTDQELDVNKVKIYFGVSVNSINRKNDENVFMDMDKYLTIFNGSINNKIFNEYGENDFLVTYDDKYYLVFRHFKKHSRGQHDYHFYFTKKENSIVIEVDIEGQDKMKFSHKMIPIREASMHRSNVPIDQAGNVYNGVELIR